MAKICPLFSMHHLHDFILIAYASLIKKATLVSIPSYIELAPKQQNKSSKCKQFNAKASCELIIHKLKS